MASLAVVLVLLLAVVFAGYVDRSATASRRYVPGVWYQRTYDGMYIEYTVRDGSIVFAQGRCADSPQMQYGWLAGHGPC